MLSVDVNLFQRTIEDLLSYAFKFSLSKSQIKIQVVLKSSILIKVIDRAVGIKPELR